MKRGEKIKKGEKSGEAKGEVREGGEAKGEVREGGEAKGEDSRVKDSGINRVTKINFSIFFVLSLMTVIVSFTKYEVSTTLHIVPIVLFFNASLGLLLILSVNKIVEISKRGYGIFIFYLILSCFLYWYIISALLHFYYGSFLSLGGLYYFLATRTSFMALAFYFCSGFLILANTFVLYFLSRKYIFEENPPKKIMNRKIRLLLILVPFVVIVIILIMLPKSSAPESTPLIESIIYFLKVKMPSIKWIGGNSTELDKVKILDVDLDVENPNFIVIMLESIPAEHLPYYGYERNITPNIDSFADRGIVFNNAYSSSAHSDYAQTSFLSSRYMITNYYRNFFDQDYPRTFMWDILKEENYATAYISSQDDDWADMKKYYNKDNLDLYADSLYDGKYDYGSGNARKDYDEVTIESCIDWVNETVKSSESFYLYINLQATHYPYEYPENNSLFEPDEPSSFTTYFDIADGDLEASVNDYDNSIYYVDKQVGVFLDYLESESLFDNTIVVLSADHGEILTRRHGYLRHGFGVYEEEVRAPLMIYLPGQEHRIIDERVRRLDVIPTLLNLSGFRLSEDFQGEVMLSNQNIYLMTQNQNFKIGMIKGDVKYMLDAFYTPEAYNLTADPFEQNNLIKTSKDKGYYSLNYGYELLDWFKCQMKYYDKESWKKGKVIDCG